METATIPPAAPPAIAPTFELLPVGEDEGEESEEGDVEVGYGEMAVVGVVREPVVPVLAEELTEIAAPAANSVPSPTANALPESQV